MYLPNSKMAEPKRRRTVMAALLPLCMCHLILTILTPVLTFEHCHSVCNITANNSMVLLWKSSNNVSRFASFNFGHVRFGRSTSRSAIRNPLAKSVKHGLLCLALPSTSCYIDLTIYTDVEQNPGPTNIESNTEKMSSRSRLRKQARSASQSKLIYTATFLLSKRGFSLITSDTLGTLKRNDLLKYRGTRAGRHKAQENFQRTLSKWISRYCSRGNLFRESQHNIINIPLQISNSTLPTVRFATWNPTSINNKVAAICDLIISNHLDILTITETWLTVSDGSTVADLKDSS